MACARRGSFLRRSQGRVFHRGREGLRERGGDRRLASSARVRRFRLLHAQHASGADLGSEHVERSGLGLHLEQLHRALRRDDVRRQPDRRLEPLPHAHGRQPHLRLAERREGGR